MLDLRLHSVAQRCPRVTPSLLLRHCVVAVAANWLSALTAGPPRDASSEATATLGASWPPIAATSVAAPCGHRAELRLGPRHGQPSSVMAAHLPVPLHLCYRTLQHSPPPLSSHQSTATLPLRAWRVLHRSRPAVLLLSTGEVGAADAHVSPHDSTAVDELPHRLAECFPCRALLLRREQVRRCK